MRKIFGKFAVAGAGLAAALAIPATVSAQGLELGVGLQYNLAGPLDEEGVSGVEVRGWHGDNIGFGVFGFYGDVEIDGESDDVARFGAKGLYAPIVRENSRFYVGLEAAYEEYGDLDGWSAMPLMGFEFRPASAPEIGLNLEIGYRYADLENGVELEQHGVAAQVGATYYF